MIIVLMLITRIMVKFDEAQVIDDDDDNINNNNNDDDDDDDDDDDINNDDDDDIVFGAYHALETLSQLMQFSFNEQSYFIPFAPWTIYDFPRLECLL